jgi:outer membrane biogenesis lipoprotein LolB
MSRREIDTGALIPFDARVVRNLLAVLCLALAGCAGATPRPYQVETPKPLPVALDHDFEIRKTKEYFLDPMAKAFTGQLDASITFERGYRTYGAITALDTHQRFGNYFDFFWRARRPADVRVRLEYRQEKLHALVQAREIHYSHARGNCKTEFAIIGDDFFDDGRVIAWRASLIVNDRVAAVTRSYLWE